MLFVYLTLIYVFLLHGVVITFPGVSGYYYDSMGCEARKV